MSRTRRGSKGPGHEFWGKRGSRTKAKNPGGSWGDGKYAKDLTHRSERRDGKEESKQGIDEC